MVINLNSRIFFAMYLEFANMPKTSSFNDMVRINKVNLLDVKWHHVFGARCKAVRDERVVVERMNFELSDNSQECH